MDAPVETAPIDAVELSLDQIVAQELSAADATGDPVVQEEKPVDLTEAETTPAETPSGKVATEDEPAATVEAKPADDVSAARARKVLAKAEDLIAQQERREKSFRDDFFAELLKSPNEALAKYAGKSIDDVIDASIAERKGAGVEPAAKTEDDRLAALERRIEEREAREAEERQSAAVKVRVAEIQRDVAASDKYPTLNAKVKSGKVSAALVTDVMTSYFREHGKPIDWDKAAALVEKDLRELAGEPAKPATAVVPKDRQDTVSIGGDTRTSAPTDGEEPEDPTRLMAYLVAKAGL